MRRFFALVLVALLGTITLVSAQEDDLSALEADKQQVSVPDGLPLEAAPSHMISGTWEPVELEEIDEPPFLREPDAPPANDFCIGSPNLVLPTDGGTTPTSDKTESDNDPALSCAWNKPPDFSGYRTVWYRFTASDNGWVTIITSGSEYDTILSVYVGSCGTKVQLACNDDFIGFDSRVKIPVSTGLTYYVEIASWHSAVSGGSTLNLGAILTTNSRWEQVTNMDVPRSRHASVIDENYIYVIGGQTTVANDPVRSWVTSRYDTVTEKWESLADFPAGDDGLGYSNTTAALVNGKIYLPSGYIGRDGIYDGTHWVYDINADFWSTAAANDRTIEPAIYSTALPYNNPPATGYFVFGGLTGPMPIPPTLPQNPWQPRKEMYFYVTGSNFWINRTPMKTARFGHTSALQHISGTDYLCTVGGIGNDGDGFPIVLSQGECYNTSTEQWSITTGPLRYPRYFAASGVDRAGNWIVYGGIDYAGNNVPATEVYNRQTNQWEILDSQSSLGPPARAWPRAGFVESTLYAIGGESNSQSSSGDVLNVVDSLYLPDIYTYLPIISSQTYHGEPDNTFDTARLLPLNLAIYGNFISHDDFIDVYYFDIPSFQGVTAMLRNIPLGSNYNLHVYSDNKLWKGSSINVGANNEDLPLTLEAGRYFIMVERAEPPHGSDPNTQSYILEISG